MCEDEWCNRGYGDARCNREGLSRVLQRPWLSHLVSSDSSCPSAAAGHLGLLWLGLALRRSSRPLPCFYTVSCLSCIASIPTFSITLNVQRVHNYHSELAHHVNKMTELASVRCRR
ncbi:hypothetical protein BD410DRAFT_794382 [Rickenella mellea]|uniref:Uncharacterized protein n=1 Tax=Rickenella mellea TaxID=50990 RepID=A0A4Y7PSD7_9AGAM|nr:hypothetical protein BD410DRAFT_794382 [Rickenella mellea]